MQEEEAKTMTQDIGTKVRKMKSSPSVAESAAFFKPASHKTPSEMSNQ
jgi:hypothetical protein